MQIMDHVNIVRLYETYETADSLFLVMEYVPGTNLDEHLRRGPLSEPEARLIFRQMVAAVDYCHQHWIVHRDLKVDSKTASGLYKTKCIEKKLTIEGDRHRMYCLHRMDKCD